MIDPQRLRDEIELQDALDQRRASQREERAWAIGICVLITHAFLHWWIFVRPERIARLTPAQLRNRRQVWLVVAAVTLITLYVYGSIQ